MTTDFFWDGVSGEYEAQRRDAALVHGKVAVAGHWPFLAAASSERDFEMRLSLSLPALEASVDPDILPDVISSLRDDYRAVTATAQCSCNKSFTGKGDKDDKCSCGHLNDTHGSDGCHGSAKTAASSTKDKDVAKVSNDAKDQAEKETGVDNSGDKADEDDDEDDDDLGKKGPKAESKDKDSDDKGKSKKLDDDKSDDDSDSTAKGHWDKDNKKWTRDTDVATKKKSARSTRTDLGPAGQKMREKDYSPEELRRAHEDAAKNDADEDRAMRRGSAYVPDPTRDGRYYAPYNNLEGVPLNNGDLQGPDGFPADLAEGEGRSTPKILQQITPGQWSEGEGMPERPMPQGVERGYRPVAHLDHEGYLVESPNFKSAGRMAPGQEDPKVDAQRGKQLQDRRNEDQLRHQVDDAINPFWEQNKQYYASKQHESYDENDHWYDLGVSDAHQLPGTDQGRHGIIHDTYGRNAHDAYSAGWEDTRFPKKPWSNGNFPGKTSSEGQPGQHTHQYPTKPNSYNKDKSEWVYHCTVSGCNGKRVNHFPPPWNQKSSAWEPPVDRASASDVQDYFLGFHHGHEGTPHPLDKNPRVPHRENKLDSEYNFGFWDGAHTKNPDLNSQPYSTQNEAVGAPIPPARQTVRRSEGNYKYVKQQGDKWVITQKGTGKVLSHHDSQEEAEASFRAMMQSKHGANSGQFNVDQDLGAKDDSEKATLGWMHGARGTNVLYPTDDAYTSGHAAGAKFRSSPWYVGDKALDKEGFITQAQSDQERGIQDAEKHSRSRPWPAYMDREEDRAQHYDLQSQEYREAYEAHARKLMDGSRDRRHGSLDKDGFLVQSLVDPAPGTPLQVNPFYFAPDPDPSGFPVDPYTEPQDRINEIYGGVPPVESTGSEEGTQDGLGYSRSTPGEQVTAAREPRNFNRTSGRLGDYGLTRNKVHRDVVTVKDHDYDPDQKLGLVKGSSYPLVRTEGDWAVVRHPQGAEIYTPSDNVVPVGQRQSHSRRKKASAIADDAMDSTLVGDGSTTNGKIVAKCPGCGDRLRIHNTPHGDERRHLKNNHVRCHGSKQASNDPAVPPADDKPISMEDQTSNSTDDLSSVTSLLKFSGLPLLALGEEGGAAGGVTDMFKGLMGGGGGHGSGHQQAAPSHDPDDDPWARDLAPVGASKKGEPCNCEHTDHFDDPDSPQTAHDYMSVPAGKYRAMHVGHVCDRCAMTHMKSYLKGTNASLDKEGFLVQSADYVGRPGPLNPSGFDPDEYKVKTWDAYKTTRPMQSMEDRNINTPVMPPAPIKTVQENSPRPGEERRDDRLEQGGDEEEEED